MANANNGQFIWYEHLTTDTRAAVVFYTEVVGWKTQPFAEGSDYVLWVASRGPIGGLYELPQEAIRMGAPPHWIGNVQVDNVDATVALVKKLGGKLYKTPEDIATVGRYAIIADPQGAALSVFRPDSPRTSRDGSKAGEICWNELLTSDSEKALSFYSELFGWELLQEMDMGPMGKYRIFGIGDQRLGGMMTTPNQTPSPPAWLYYVDTADLNAAIARATKLGAQLLNGPMDVPGGARVAQLKDPQGAAFALHQAPKS
jgi:predicted enzyme related to lactoylglutathione lyase